MSLILDALRRKSAQPEEQDEAGRPSRANSLKPRVVSAASADAPSLRPSTIPAAIASTFFAAPPISTPRTSVV